jgi:hypothetical protein
VLYNILFAGRRTHGLTITIITIITDITIINFLTIYYNNTCPPHGQAAPAPAVAQRLRLAQQGGEVFLVRMLRLVLTLREHHTGVLVVN